MSEKIKLKDLFSGLQKQVEARFSTNREFIKHPGSKGDSLENVWINWLREYLPNRYCVDKAFVIDSKGQLSQQLDLVIYDQHFTPFVFKQDGVMYIPAEGVYAVFEVKPDLKGSVEVKKKSISHIEYAGRKVASVRKLHRTSTLIIDRGNKRAPRPLTKIIGGILAVENGYSSDKTLEKHLDSLDNNKSLDMGCAVASGSFYLNYIVADDHETKDIDKVVRGLFEQNKTAEIELLYEKEIQSYYKNRTISEIEFSSSEHSLVTFFLQLSKYLQTIGSVAAIDLNAYAKSIKFEIDEEI